MRAGSVILNDDDVALLLTAERRGMDNYTKGTEKRLLQSYASLETRTANKS